MSKYVVFGKDGCGFCEKAKQLLDMTDSEYEYRNTTEDPKALEKFKSFGHPTYPLVFKDGVMIGGYEDLIGVIYE